MPTQPHFPTYFAKIINPITGSVIAAPLVDAGIQFQETIFVAGQHQKGSFTIDLPNIYDPVYRANRDIYHNVLKKYRIEIYDNIDMLNNPVFAGVIQSLPSDIGKIQFKGENSLVRLDDRRIYRNQTISGNAGDAVKSLLKTYQPIFTDDFNTLPDTNWNTSIGSWTISGGSAHCTATDILYTVAAFSDYLWNGAKISFDAILPIGDELQLLIAYDALNYVSVDILAAYGTHLPYFVVNDVAPGPTVTTLATRDYPYDTTGYSSGTTYNHYDVLTWLEGTSRRVIVLLNGIEMINVLDANPNTNNTAYLIFASAFGSGTIYLDNVVFATAQSAIQIGTFDTTTVTLIAPAQQFSNDSQFSGLDWFTEYASMEYRLNPGIGEGYDTLDWQVSVGIDYSTQVCLYEGDVDFMPNAINIPIVALKRDNSSTPLANWITAYGQAQADGMGNSVVYDISSWATYPIVEDDYSDSRIVTPDIGNLLARNRLAITSQGQDSISGSIIDLSSLIEQNPLIGGVVIGDAIVGGRKALRAGDYVWLKSDTLNVDKKVRIVGITRTSATDQIDLTFDYFPNRNTNDFKTFANMLDLLRRGFIQTINSLTNGFTFTTTGTQYWYPYMEGSVPSVSVVIRVSGAGATFVVLVDGTDVTNALFGSATLTGSAPAGQAATFNATDTQYLTAQGGHTFAIQVTAGSGAFSITLTPKIYT